MLARNNAEIGLGPGLGKEAQGRRNGIACELGSGADVCLMISIFISLVPPVYQMGGG